MSNKMSNNYTIVGLDLSKTSTGVSIVEVNNNSLKILDIFSVRVDYKREINKTYFYAKDLLIKEITKVFDSLEGSNFSVAIESNIYSDYMSELQFYLTQEILLLCYTKGVNVVGYSPMSLKMFVKLFITDGRKYPACLEKEDIREIYENYLIPLNKDVLYESSRIIDSDSMDAFFLALLGSIFQRNITVDLSHLIDQEITHQGILDHKFDELLLIDHNYYYYNYFKEIWDFTYDNFKFNGEGLIFGKQFKKFIIKTRDKQHLTLSSKLFFPFSFSSILNQKMKEFREKRPEEFFDFWTKYLGTRKKLLKSKLPLEKDFLCLFNKRGDYFLKEVNGDIIGRK